MCKFMKQSLSILLALVLVINLLPLNVLSIGTSISVEEDDNTVTTVTTPYERSSTAKIVEEDTSKRSEYYKEFVLFL